MTKEHEMKNNLCKYVKDLAISDLFILTLYLEDLSKPELPDAATLVCEKCKEVYGDCMNEIDDTSWIDLCEKRFCEYCKTECGDTTI